MDVRVIETVLFRGDVLVTFSDSKVAICKAQEVYKFALSVEALLEQEGLPLP